MQTDHDRFLSEAAKAEECVQLAKAAAARGDRMLLEHYTRAAKDFRRSACGFDYRPAVREFEQIRARVSLGLNQATMDALSEMGVPRVDFARTLKWILEEAVLSIRDCTPDALKVRTGNLRLHATQRPGDEGRRFQLWNENIETAAEISFRLCKAEIDAAEQSVSAPSPARPIFGGNSEP